MIPKAAIPEFNALLVRHLREPRFDPHWHFHPEFQLFLVLRGTGTRFIGDQVRRFGPGDLVLTGPNLPHLWRSDEAATAGATGSEAEGIVVYFRDVILNDGLLDTQEGAKIRQLLARSARGLAFRGAAQRQTARHLDDLLEAEGFDRILGLLRILHTLSLTDEYQVLSREGYANPLRTADPARMEKVVSYIMEHFSRPIRLADVAAVANMADTAFCRYFKEHTNLSLFRFIAELRIGYACKLLAEEELSVTRIAYRCGYRTLSNFNRQFKGIAGLTPREFRRGSGDVPRN
jgi:AraC-like DNA-binding protein